MTDTLTPAAANLLRLIRDGYVAYSAWRVWKWDYATNERDENAPIAVDFRRTDRRSHNGVTARVTALIGRGLVIDPHAADGERGTATPTQAGIDALAAQDTPEPGAAHPTGRQACYCKHCARPIFRDSPGQPWAVHNLYSTDPQCHRAPNPDEGPTPGHEPGTPIATEVLPSAERVDPTILPPLVIPRIPHAASRLNAVGTTADSPTTLPCNSSSRSSGSGPSSAGRPGDPPAS